jgi:membrane fusion protein (multidrug efflux system)
MNRLVTFSTKSGLLILLLVALVNCKQKQSVQLPPQEVKVVEVQQRDIERKVDFIAQVYGYQDISIRARVSGFLVGIHFDEGFPVKKGQLLYTIDDQPFQTEVAAMQSKLAEAKSVFAKAQSDLNRYKPLAESNAVSQADLDAAQVQYEAAEAQVQAAEANLEMAKIQLGYTNVYSPIDGIIGKSMAEIGELVGQMPLVVLNTVSKMDKIHVEFFLPENAYLQIVKNIKDPGQLFEQRDSINKNLELVLADGSIHKYKGGATFIDRGVDSNTGTILVQTRFDNPDRIVRPGQFASIRIPVSYDDAFVIPQKCVKELQGQYSVFVVNSENVVENRQIAAGVTIGDMWVVTNGLEKGERIVIDGIQKVRNGVTVVPTLTEFKSQDASL